MGKFRGVIVVNRERCKGCNLCVVACPFHLLALAEKQVNKKGYHYAEQIRKDACNGCASCAVVCPDGCITVYREKEE